MHCPGHTLFTELLPLLLLTDSLRQPVSTAAGRTMHEGVGIGSDKGSLKDSVLVELSAAGRDAVANPLPTPDARSKSLRHTKGRACASQRALPHNRQGPPPSRGGMW
uniref:Secreted protein n=1 Tax=Eutreptiella gymnastica TaxID=73025 RepID=A0A7S4CVB6_9EUGL